MEKFAHLHRHTDRRPGTLCNQLVDRAQIPPRTSRETAATVQQQSGTAAAGVLEPVLSPAGWGCAELPPSEAAQARPRRTDGSNSESDQPTRQVGDQTAAPLGYPANTPPHSVPI